MNNVTAESYNKIFSYFIKAVFVLFVLIYTNKSYAQTKVVQDTLINFYTVQMGENLYTISFKFKVSKELICKVNNCKTYSDLKLITGNRIRIPKLINRVIVLNDSMIAYDNVIRAKFVQDSTNEYNSLMQKREDSLFLIYVALDKKRDSIDKLKQAVSDDFKLKNDSIKYAINNINDELLKKHRDDSLKKYQNDIRVNLRIKDSINEYDASLKKIDSINRINELISLEQYKIDSIELYKSGLKELEKAKEDSIQVYLENAIELQKKDSLLIYNNYIDSIENFNFIAKQNLIDSTSKIKMDNDSIEIFQTQLHKQFVKDSIETYKAFIITEKTIKKAYRDSVQLYEKTALSNAKSQDTAKLVVQSISKNKLNKSNISYTVIDDTMIVIDDSSYLLLESKKVKSNNIKKDTSKIESDDKINDLSEVNIKETKKKKKFKIGDKVPESDIQKSDFYLARAMKSIDQKEYDNAQLFINKAISLNPNNTEAYILLADMYASFNYFDKAAKEYGKAILTDNNMPVLYYNRGAVYLKMNELTKSLLDFNAAIKLDSQYVLAIGGRAAILLLRKNYQLAIQDYSTIIDLNAYFTPAYKARAEAYIEVGNFKNAIEDCDKYLETNPDDAYVYYQRGMARIKDGEFYKSCIDLLKSSELGYPEAKSALKKFCK